MQRPVHTAVAGAVVALLGAVGATVAASPSLASPTSTPAAAAAFASTDLDSSGDGYPVYRIPALTQTNAGTLIASYDGRPSGADVPSNIDLVVRRSTDGGATWQNRLVVRHEDGKPGFGDPSIVVDRQTGRIWIFHVASINQGYFGSATGNDESNPDILQMDVSYSDDDGLTWKDRRLTHEAKDPAWGGLFASSGEGIQIRKGKYAGRLVQQYAVRHQGGNWAASLISDDHGVTWRFGQLLGPGMDENKVVELSDGRLMLNSRAPGGFRKVAFSGDGGEHWTGLRTETQLVDPANNGSIIRLAPDAAPQSADAKKLLFSNTADPSSRRNLTVKQSCDSGVTWPISKVIEPGAAAYSTLTPLKDGSAGLLWERDGYKHITYTHVTQDVLDGVCAPLTVSTSGTAQAGTTKDVSVTVKSQETGAITQGKVSLDLPAGFTAPEVAVPKLATGDRVIVTIPVTVPEGVDTNAYPVTANFTSNKGASTSQGSIVVEGGTLVLSDSSERTYDGQTITDLTAQVDKVKDLTGGAIKVKFTASGAPTVGTLLSLSDPVSAVRDVVVSLNAGTPYVEVRTATSTYPVRLASATNVADGKQHQLIAASNNGRTSLILDGAVIAQVAGQGFFSNVTALTKPFDPINPSGKPNLTLGMNRGHFSVGGGPAAPNNRWGFVGTIHSVEVYNDLAEGEEAIPSSQLSVSSVDSEETVGEDGAGANAVDGNPATIWHTHWSGGVVDPMPHQITIDLGADEQVHALRYLRRQDSGTNGDIGDYRISTSEDGTTWSPAAEGRFGAGKGEEEVRFTSRSARYLRLEALSAANGLEFASAAELRPLRSR